MKSITYILIAVFISSILISALPTSIKTEKKVVSIQCIEDKPSKDLLAKSARIIQSRLIDYGISNFDINIDQETSCINLLTDEQAKLADFTSLLSSKGKLEFYETYDRLEQIKNLGIDKDFAQILNIPFQKEVVNGSSGILGYCQKDKIAGVDLYLNKHYTSKPNNGINFCWSERANDKQNFNLFLLKNKAILDKSYISESNVKSDLSNNTHVLNITFNESGKSIWKDVTKGNIGKSIAIVLDKKVLQSPIIMSEISGGKCTISGNFSKNEISRISSLINNEELPLKFELKN